MPELFGELVQVKSTQDVEERFSTHVGAEDLPPTRFQFTIAALTHKSKRPQVKQFIAQAGILIACLGSLIFQLVTQVFHSQLCFGSHPPDIQIYVLQIALLLVLELAFEIFQTFLNNFLDVRKMLIRDCLTFFYDGDIRISKVNGCFGCLVDLLLQITFQALASFDDRIESLGHIFFVILLNILLLLLEVAELTITGGLDFGDLGIDLRALFTLGDHYLLFKSLERFLASILVNIGDYVLRKI